MEDGGGPSGDGLQDQFPNHPALRGDEIPGGERIGKRRARPVRCGPGRRTQVNRRGAVERDTDAIETRPLLAVWDEVQRGPAYWLSGGRQRGGASLVQAFMRNVGTWRSDEKGEAQGAGTPRVRVPTRSAGADQLVVAMKPGNAGGAKGLNRPAAGVSQPARGGAHV